MNRTPPVEVRRKLRHEVGFGCPVNGCGSPYLIWHHFDPPWREREHQNPEGMLALCREHHDQADGGAFTMEQLRALKTKGRDPGLLAARFNWMRNDLVTVVGGNFYLDTYIIWQIRDRPLVWLRRDERGHLLLNVDMPTSSGEPRMVIRDNWWMTEGEEEAEIECPPNGRLVAASYPNGDRMRIEFHESENAEAFDLRYPRPRHEPPEGVHPKVRMLYVSSNSELLLDFGGAFPVTSVEVEMNVADPPISFTPSASRVGNVTVVGGWTSGLAVAIRAN